MGWTVLIDEAFADELAHVDAAVSFQLVAMSALLAEFGPHLGRPRADTLKGSKHSNMKELRFELPMASGALPSHLILFDRRFCLWRATNPEFRRSGSTRGSSKLRTSDLTHIFVL